MSLVVRDLTTGEVQAHPIQVNDTEVSLKTISTITNRQLASARRAARSQRQGSRP